MSGVDPFSRRSSIASDSSYVVVPPEFPTEITEILAKHAAVPRGGNGTLHPELRPSSPALPQRGTTQSRRSSFAASVPNVAGSNPTTAAASTAVSAASIQSEQAAKQKMCSDKFQEFHNKTLTLLENINDNNWRAQGTGLPNLGNEIEKFINENPQIALPMALQMSADLKAQVESSNNWPEPRRKIGFTAAAIPLNRSAKFERQAGEIFKKQGQLAAGNECLKNAVIHAKRAEELHQQGMPADQFRALEALQVQIRSAGNEKDVDDCLGRVETIYNKFKTDLTNGDKDLNRQGVQSEFEAAAGGAFYYAAHNENITKDKAVEILEKPVLIHSDPDRLRRNWGVFGRVNQEKSIEFAKKILQNKMGSDIQREIAQEYLDDTNLLIQQYINDPQLGPSTKVK